MPRYFFDIHDSGSTRDDTGTECADDEAARKLAIRTLPDIARDEIPKDGDRRVSWSSSVMRLGNRSSRRR